MSLGCCSDVVSAITCIELVGTWSPAQPCTTMTRGSMSRIRAAFMPWPWWLRVATSTRPAADATGVTVSISKPFTFRES
eukprot:4589958-Pleurochrysis_carterae.AAC.3